MSRFSNAGNDRHDDTVGRNWRAAIGDAPDVQASRELLQRDRKLNNFPVLDGFNFDPRKGVLRSDYNEDITLDICVRNFVPTFLETVRGAAGEAVGFLYADGISNPVPIVVVGNDMVAVHWFDQDKNKLTEKPIFSQTFQAGQELAVIRLAHGVVTAEINNPGSQTTPVEVAPIEPAPTKKTERKRTSAIHSLGVFDVAHQIFSVTGRNRGDVDLRVPGLPPCVVTEIKVDDRVTLHFSYTQKQTQQLVISYDSKSGNIVNLMGPVDYRFGVSTKELITAFVEHVRREVGTKNEPQTFENKLENILTVWDQAYTDPTQRLEAVRQWLDAHNMHTNQSSFEDVFAADVILDVAEVLALPDNHPNKKDRLEVLQSSLTGNAAYFPAELQARLLTEVESGLDSVVEIVPPADVVATIENDSTPKYVGAVDAQGDYHDPNGRLTIGNREWVGNFVHGQLHEGLELENGVVVFTGTFCDGLHRADGLEFDPQAPAGSQWLVKTYRKKETDDPESVTCGQAENFEQAYEIFEALNEVPSSNEVIEVSVEAEAQNTTITAGDVWRFLGPEKLHTLVGMLTTDVAGARAEFATLADTFLENADFTNRLPQLGFADQESFIQWWQTRGAEQTFGAVQVAVLGAMEREVAALQTEATNQAKANQKTTSRLLSWGKKLALNWGAGAAAGVAGAGVAAQAGAGPLLTVLAGITSAIQGSRSVREHQARPQSIQTQNSFEQTDRWLMAEQAQKNFIAQDTTQLCEMVAAHVAAAFENTRQKKDLTSVHVKALQTLALRSVETESVEKNERVLDYLVAAGDFRIDQLRNGLLDPAQSELIGQKLSFWSELKQALKQGQVLNLWANETSITKRLTGRAVETVVGTAVGFGLNAAAGLALPAKLAARFGLGAIVGGTRGWLQAETQEAKEHRALEQKKIQSDVHLVRELWRTHPQAALELTTNPDCLLALQNIATSVDKAIKNPTLQLFAGAETVFVQANELLRELKSELPVQAVIIKNQEHNQTLSPVAKPEQTTSAWNRAFAALKQGLQKGALYNMFGGAIDLFRELTQQSVAASAPRPTKLAPTVETSNPRNFDATESARMPARGLEEIAPVIHVEPSVGSVAFWQDFKTEHSLDEKTTQHFQALYNEFKHSLSRDELNELVGASQQKAGQGVESALSREFKILHEALRDQTDPEKITTDLHNLYSLVGYKPKGDQVPEWADVKTAFAREAHRVAVRSGHITPDGLYQKVIMFKPGVLQRQVLGVSNGEFVAVHDQPAGAPLQKDLLTPTSKAALRGESVAPNETTLYDSGRVQTATRFVTELTGGLYGRGIVPEFSEAELAAIGPEATIAQVERIGDQVLVTFSNGAHVRGYPVEDGNAIWHLFPAQSGGKGELTPTSAALPDDSSEKAPLPKSVATVDRAPVEITLANGARVVVKVGSNGRAILDIFGQPKVNLGQARQTLFGDAGYPARVSVAQHDSLDTQVRQVYLGLQTYEALRVAGKDGGAAEALRQDLLFALKQLAKTTGNDTVRQIVTPRVLNSLGAR